MQRVVNVYDHSDQQLANIVTIMNGGFILKLVSCFSSLLSLIIMNTCASSVEQSFFCNYGLARTLLQVLEEVFSIPHFLLHMCVNINISVLEPHGCWGSKTFPALGYS